MMQNGTVGTLQDLNAYPANLETSTNALFDKMQGTVNTIVNNATGLVDEVLGTSGASSNLGGGNLNATLENLFQKMGNLQNTLDSLLTSVDRAQLNASTLISIAVALSNTLTQIGSNITSLNSVRQSNDGAIIRQYTITPQVPATNAQVDPALINSIPNITEITAPIRAPAIPNLRQLSSDIRGEYTAATAKIKDTVNQQATTVTNDVTAQLNTQRASVMQTISRDIKSQLQAQTAPAINDLNRIFDMIKPYDAIRSAVHFSLLSVTVGVIICIVSFVLLRRPPGVKGCTMASVVFWLLLLLLAIIYLIISFALGEVCYQTFDQRGAAFVPLLPASSSKYIPLIFQARDDCMAGSSILDVANKAGYLNNFNKDDVNITKKVQTALDQVNFNQIVSQINLNNTLPLSQNQNIDQKLNTTQTNSVLTEIDRVASLSVLDPATNVVPNANTLSQLATALGAYLTNGRFDEGNIDWNNGRPSQQAIVDAILQQYTTDVLALQSSLLNIVNVVIPNIDTRRGLLRQTVNGLKAPADAALQEANTLATTFKSSLTEISNVVNNTKSEVLNRVPRLKNDALQAGVGLQQDLDRALQCQMFAQDTYVIENVACSMFVISLDSIWLSFLVLGLTSLFSIPVYIVAAHRLADRSANSVYAIQDTVADEEKGGKKKEGKNKKGIVKASANFSRSLLLLTLALSPSAASGIQKTAMMEPDPESPQPFQAFQASEEPNSDEAGVANDAGMDGAAADVQDVPAEEPAPEYNEPEIEAHPEPEPEPEAQAEPDPYDDFEAAVVEYADEVAPEPAHIDEEPHEIHEQPQLEEDFTPAPRGYIPPPPPPPPPGWSMRIATTEEQGGEVQAQSLPEAGEERSALLAAIRGFNSTKLKPTETNDRSAPIFE
ncbi:hypothetical protein HK102_001692 [Quaeritorhiza haematococci]|nr:hypothetical protein HK102_001692 [Quaeritorhiza haematococci]